MQRQLRWLIICLLFLALACRGGQELLPTPSPTPTAIPLPPTQPPPSPTPPPTNTPRPTATPLPTATPDVAADFVPVSDPVHGLQFRYPATWLTDLIDGDGEQIFIMAANQEWLDGDGPGEGAVIGVMTRPGHTPADMLATVVAEFPLSDQATVVEEGLTGHVNDRPMVQQIMQAITEQGEDLTALYTVIQGDEQLIVILAAAPTAQFGELRPVLEAIIGSVQVLKPTVTPTPLTWLNYQSSDSRLTLLYPAGWLEEEAALDDGNTLVFASDEALLDDMNSGESGGMLRIYLGVAQNVPFWDDSADLLGNMAAFLDYVGVPAGRTHQPPTITYFNGLMGVQAAFSSDQPVGSLSTLILLPLADQLLVGFAATTNDSQVQNQPILAAMLASLSLATVPETTTYENADLTLRYPTTWFQETDGDQLILASSQEMLDAPSPAGIAEGAGITLDRVNNGGPESDPLTILGESTAEFLDNAPEGVTIETLEAAHLISLNGAIAAATTYHVTFDGVALIVRYMAFLQNDHSLVAYTVALEVSAGTYQPILNAILNTITLLP